jgi:hypothetical protein
MPLAAAVVIESMVRLGGSKRAAKETKCQIPSKFSR